MTQDFPNICSALKSIFLHSREVWLNWLCYKNEMESDHWERLGFSICYSSWKYIRATYSVITFWAYSCYYIFCQKRETEVVQWSRLSYIIALLLRHSMEQWMKKIMCSCDRQSWGESEWYQDMGRLANQANLRVRWQKSESSRGRRGQYRGRTKEWEHKAEQEKKQTKSLIKPGFSLSSLQPPHSYPHRCLDCPFWPPPPQLTSTDYWISSPQSHTHTHTISSH